MRLGGRLVEASGAALIWVSGQGCSPLNRGIVLSEKGHCRGNGKIDRSKSTRFELI